MNTNKNYYQILQVETQATEDEIREAYRVLARQYHHNSDNQPKAKQLLKAIQEAYAVLGDPKQRRLYDRQQQAEGRDKSATINLRATSSHNFLLTQLPEQAFYVLLDITPALTLPASRLPLAAGRNGCGTTRRGR